jgi:putative peptidoglycan lipid II flippase
MEIQANIGGEGILHSMRSWIAKFLPRGSTTLALTTLGSYILGLGRDRIFAQTYGASTALDSYNAAFLVPDFLFNLLVASGIAAAAVPLFTELSRHHRQEAYGYMNALLLVATLAAAVCALLVIIFAPLLSILVAPGLDAGERVLVVQLMRMLAIPPLLFAGSNALGAMLVAEQRFLFYGLSPMLYNLGIIGGTILLAQQWGIMGTVVGLYQFGIFILLQCGARCA